MTAEHEAISLDLRRATAFHEAGHAVAFWRFGQEIEIVTIEPSTSRLGFVRAAAGSSVVDLCARHVRGLDSYWQLPETVMQVVIYQAGVAAGARAGYADQVAGIDMSESTRLASEVCADVAERDAFIAWCAERARAMFAPPNVWRATTELAEALLVQVTIDGNAAEKLIERILDPDAESRRFAEWRHVRRQRELRGF